MVCQWDTWAGACVCEDGQCPGTLWRTGCTDHDEVIQIVEYVCCRTPHSRASAIALKILGADLSPNGSIGSTYTCSPHSTACKWWSSGWTGTRRYADSMSTFLRRAPRGRRPLQRLLVQRSNISGCIALPRSCHSHWILGGGTSL